MPTAPLQQQNNGTRPLKVLLYQSPNEHDDGNRQHDVQHPCQLLPNQWFCFLFIDDALHGNHLIDGDGIGWTYSIHMNGVVDALNLHHDAITLDGVRYRVGDD